jgi:prefoldin subunit 5
MKKYTLVISLLIFMSLNNIAQSLVPEKSTIEHNNKMRPCLMVKLDPEPKTLKNAWIDFLRKEYDFKLKGMGWFSNKDLLHAEEVTIEKLSSKQMDFYTYVEEDENGSEMKVFASLGYDIYLNEKEYPVEFEKMNEMMVSFLKQYLPKYYNKIIDESAKRVKSLNKEITTLKKNIKDNNENIEKLNNEIEQYKTSIEENSIKLNAAESKLKGRQDKLERVKTKLRAM